MHSTKETQKRLAGIYESQETELARGYGSSSIGVECYPSDSGEHYRS